MAARLGLLITLFLAVAGGSAAYEPERVSIPLAVDGMPVDRTIAFAAVPPGATLTLDAPAGVRLVVESATGEVRSGLGRVEWPLAFAPGHYPLRLRPAGGDAVLLQVFVMVPAWQVREGWVEGYEIGAYPLPPEDRPVAYARPEGFIRVSEAHADLAVSPHFRLGQFLSKQDSGWPKFLLLSPRLVAKLEWLLSELNARGVAAESLHVMSGYRTPAYNARLGNVPLSRHLYGDAADVFVDSAPDDGRMDDLDGDGHGTRADAAALYDLADALGDAAATRRLSGGIGVYDATRWHGPFVHIDVRGHRARWGRWRAILATREETSPLDPDQRVGLTAGLEGNAPERNR